MTNEQLEAILKGDSKIPGYTCHHHQDTGRGIGKCIDGESQWLNGATGRLIPHSYGRGGHGEEGGGE
ncbi:HNH endonuclease [Rodentibacter pneumotropicus]|uniref:HNH endonuclease n=1 Tax=Rodentibacter pneumotropicus TaxID=758 RepID=UPI00192D7DCD|nr:HNH endonuclease [Rodentibacter pneumotropicus]